MQTLAGIDNELKSNLQKHKQDLMVTIAPINIINQLNTEETNDTLPSDQQTEFETSLQTLIPEEQIQE